MSRRKSLTVPVGGDGVELKGNRILTVSSVESDPHKDDCFAAFVTCNSPVIREGGCVVYPNMVSRMEPGTRFSVGQETFRVDKIARSGLVLKPSQIPSVQRKRA